MIAISNFFAVVTRLGYNFVLVVGRIGWDPYFGVGLGRVKKVSLYKSMSSDCGCRIRSLLHTARKVEDRLVSIATQRPNYWG